MSIDDLPQQVLVRRSPTLRPFAAPWPQLVAVTDTNALAARSCRAAHHGLPEDVFTELSVTGRSNTFVAAHVPDELTDHLRDVAESTRTDYSDAARVLWGEIMPAIPVVDLAIRDYLHPHIRTFLHTDRDLPRSMRGDPDDIGTAALAEFLAPTVILSADSVFTRLGLSNTTAVAWVNLAHALLRAAGLEATLGDAALVAELAPAFRACASIWSASRGSELVKCC